MSSDVGWHIRLRQAETNAEAWFNINQKARYDRQPRTATSTVTQLLNYVNGQCCRTTYKRCHRGRSSQCALSDAVRLFAGIVIQWMTPLVVRTSTPQAEIDSTLPFSVYSQRHYTTEPLYSVFVTVTEPAFFGRGGIETIQCPWPRREAS